MNLFKKKIKIFCIGTGKTGTSTMERTLKDFGFSMGDQHQGELLLTDWFQRDFSKILKHSKTADAFQDIPYSLPYTYQFLDQHFKNAKFILTERDSASQWYRSITGFHSKLWADGTNTPTAEDLKNAKYCYRGFAYKAHKYLYNTPDDDLYNEQAMKAFYVQHNAAIKDYFRYRKDKLTVINVARDGDYKRLCEFLGQKQERETFPWENKTNSL